MMPSNQRIPRIALTSGEPAGIGPDICLRLADQELPCQLVVIASPTLLRERAELLNIKVELRIFDNNLSPESHQAGQLLIYPVELTQKVQCGRLNALNSRYILKTINKAVHGCLHGVFDAMVTAPVHKGIINDAGYAFSGHTEYIAELTGGNPVMMLATQGLRVALATTHLPLSQVSGALTHHRLRTVLRVLNQELKSKFKIERPTIAVCGLNPHAGENGHFGQEELEIIQPVIEGLQKQGLNLIGPLPADTVFTPKYLDSADAVLAMYHDQGLPVLKYKGFGQAVNITLGLPIIRTSVDHGTALDLAGTGKADHHSLLGAIETAVAMATI